MRRFAVFVGVGLLCAALDVGLMKLLLLWDVQHVVAATAGFAFGLAANVVLHTRVTFSAQFSNRVLWRFGTVVLINYLITIGFVALFDAWLGSAMTGKIVSLPVVAVNGFLLSKHWVYR